MSKTDKTRIAVVGLAVFVLYCLSQYGHEQGPAPHPVAAAPAVQQEYTPSPEVWAMTQAACTRAAEMKYEVQGLDRHKSYEECLVIHKRILSEIREGKRP